ncbi:MAG: hypothetical protein GY720_12410 [bacterium]|nr:hypothetical protein [bacterium]
MNHHQLIDRVLALADKARARGDHPSDALLSVDGVVVCEARNRVVPTSDSTAHAAGRPQLLFTGPERQDEAAESHKGFWASR